MSRITQRTDPDAQSHRLAAAGARAAIAVVAAGAALPSPVLYVRRGDAHWIGVAPEQVPDPQARARAVLVLDAGTAWFELRAVTWRGRIEAPEPPPFAPGGESVWMRFVPVGAVAWDYATLHEEPDA